LIGKGVLKPKIVGVF